MSERLRRGSLLLMIIWFSLLAILFTWPLLMNCMHSIAGEIGDNIYFVWMIGWTQKALFQQHSNPLDVWFLNYPEGWNMARTEMAPLQLILALPFSLIGGETFGYNMVMLLSFMLSGLIMCLWVRHLSGSTMAGVISGTIFACLPYRQAHFLIGHLNLSGTQWLPLFFWGWFDLLKPGLKEFRKNPALLAALGLGFTALSSQYYFFMTVIIAAICAVFMFSFKERGRFHDKATWQSFGLFLLSSLPLLLAAELPFLTLASSGGMPNRDWGSVRMYSAGLSDYMLPGTMHFLFGQWVGEHFNRDIWIEATLYIGFFSLILLIIGFIWRKRPDSWLWQILICGIISAIVLSMGTDLHWNGDAIEWQLPVSLAEKLGRERLPIVLPGLVFFKFFPFFGKLRAMMRFGLFALIFCACGAGLGVKALIERIPVHVGKMVFVLCMALVLFDFYPRPINQFSEVKPREVDLWLAQQAGDGSVMRIPFYLNDDQAGTYYTLYNEKPFIGGFFNAFPPEQYKNISEMMDSFPTKASLAKAVDLGVDFFMLEKDGVEAAIEQGKTNWTSYDELKDAFINNGLIPIVTLDNITIYQFTDDCDCTWLKR